MKKRVLIMGASGKDFHVFNMIYRNNKNYQVVAFTHSQVPVLTRLYPKELAGKNYPKGILIYPEEKLAELIKKYKVDEVVLAYSDLSHIEVMHKASIALANGADFVLHGPESTMLKSKRPVISVCAVRTGAGKSPTSRKVVQILKSLGKRVVVVRHAMPYQRDLTKQICQRFASLDDLKEQGATIEELEEYYPHIKEGTVVYAGVDYEKILRQGEKEADVIVFDGGNNDLSFIKSDLHIVVADARRPGHELSYYPGEANLRMADVVIVNKVDMANPADIDIVINNVKMTNPMAIIIKAAMPITIDRPELIRGKRILAIEDGPSLTHGGLSSGAATIAAKNLGAYVINPRDKAVGSIKNVYVEYPHLGTALPAMGYSRKQMEELQETINAVDCDSVLIGTPLDLREFLVINKPAAKVNYELREIGKPDLRDIIIRFLAKIKSK